MSQGEIKLAEVRRTRTLSSGLIITAPSEDPPYIPEAERRVISPTTAFPSSSTLSPPATKGRKHSGDSRGSSHSDLGGLPRLLSVTTASSDIFSRTSTNPEELSYREVVLSAIKVNRIKNFAAAYDIAVMCALKFIEELPREEVKAMQIRVNATHCCFSLNTIHPEDEAASVFNDFAEKYLKHIEKTSLPNFAAISMTAINYGSSGIFTRARGQLRVLYEYLQIIKTQRLATGQGPATPRPSLLQSRRKNSV